MIINPNNFSVVNANFVDPLDSKLLGVSGTGTSSCGGSVVVSFFQVVVSGATVPALGSCTIQAVVTGLTSGVAPNSFTLIASNTPSVSVVPVSLTVMGALVATKTFSPEAVPIGSSVAGSLVLSNDNSQAVTGRPVRV